MQLWRDREMTEKCNKGQYATEKQSRERIGQIQKTLCSWWRRKFAHLVSKKDDYWNSQETDHLSNQGAEGQRQINIDRGNKIDQVESGAWLLG